MVGWDGGVGTEGLGQGAGLASLSLFIKYLFIYLCGLLVVACGISFPDRGWKLGPLHWERRVLATRPAGKPTFSSILSFAFDPWHLLVAM